MKPERCATCGRRKKRSTVANRRYFALVSLCVPFVYNGQRWSKVQWHALFKDMFLEPVTVKLPDGRTVVRDPESNDLDADEFNAFMDKVEAWCSEHELFLPEEVI